LLTFSEWFDRLCATCTREDGQTMAEYAVVLAVITATTVAVFTALGDGAEGAVNRVLGFFPG
jgi:Flp pilus assembly pilin Flp